MTNSERLRERPSILYRYFSPERIDVLENMELRFSRPSEFNDTFDTHYLVPRDQSTKRSLERVRLRAKLGILCLTEQSNNHLMWVNYARNHTGFVLGFEGRWLTRWVLSGVEEATAMKWLLREWVRQTGGRDADCS